MNSGLFKKGHKFSKEILTKRGNSISKSKKGMKYKIVNKNKGWFIKGKSPLNKGKKTNKDVLLKLSKIRKGKRVSIKTEFKKGDTIREKNVNWKGGITPLTKQIRHCFKYRQWISDIFQRDAYTCQECNQKGGKLNAHHVKEFSKIIEEYKIKTLEQALNCEELWNINNGLTLCKDCHKKTKNYGRKKD